MNCFVCELPQASEESMLRHIRPCRRRENDDINRRIGELKAAPPGVRLVDRNKQDRKARAIWNKMRELAAAEAGKPAPAVAS